MAENIDKKELKEKRRIESQLAILKASNELLSQTRDSALSRDIDDDTRDRLEEQFNEAIEENKMKAQTYLQQSPDKIEDAEYKEVSQYYVDKYNDRLSKKGITDDYLHQKTGAIAVNKKQREKDGIVRRKRLGSQNNEDMGEEIIRLENEDELMKKSMANDKSKIEKRRERNLKDENMKIKEESDKLEKLKKEFVQTVEEKKVNTKTEPLPNIIEAKDAEEAKEKKNIKKNSQHVERKVKKSKVVKYDFNFDDIPSYIQYDVLPLPSKGECYPIDSPLRCGKIPVAYLTASDENLIASPNMYRDGKLLDMIIKRKVLDKRINTDELCTGDRDAIILWLRATSYGEEFPIVTTNPDTGKKYNVTINLSDLDYLDFNLEGDENGLFDYKTSNGDLIKFKFFTKDDEDILRNLITEKVVNMNKLEILKSTRIIAENLTNIGLENDEEAMIKEDIDEINTIIGKNAENDVDDDLLIPTGITDRMINYTVSINGNEDKDFVRLYIENMRTIDSLNYRNYFVDNTPGVDFNIKIEIPESDGGGSFETFLRFDDTIFLNF